MWLPMKARTGFWVLHSGHVAFPLTCAPFGWGACLPVRRAMARWAAWALAIGGSRGLRYWLMAASLMRFLRAGQPHQVAFTC